MKSFRSKTFTFAAALACALLFAACQEKPTATEPDASATLHEAATKRYPLRGVVLEVDASAPALLVKHEEIPGYMAAMTMQFPVDAEVTKRVEKDQTITATLVVEAAGFHLEDVKAVEDAAAP